MKYRYKGALHIHSTHSDGTGSLEEIVSSAKKAGLSWIIITDHNNLNGIAREGFHDGIAVIVGQEVSPKHGDHYLALGLKEVVASDLGPQGTINKVKELGGLGFIAHPDENTQRQNSYRPLVWTDWNVTGFDGIEIWNHLSDWVDAYSAKSALYQYLFRNNVLNGPSQKTLSWWDNLNKNNDGIISAVGGADAHALKVKAGPATLKIFPYLCAFKSVINDLYLDEPLASKFETAKQQIHSALKGGNNVIFNRAWGEAYSFAIYSTDEIAYAGDSIVNNEDTELYAEFNKKIELKVVKNGECIFKKIGKKFSLAITDTGKYRIEAHYKGKPWLFSNPITVR